VNQRASGNITTDEGFAADRWKLGVNGAATLALVPMPLGELPESATNCLRMVTTTQSGVANYANTSHRIESVRTLSGKTVTISFWARAPISGTPKIAIEFEQYFGSGGSPSAAVQTRVGQITLSGTWVRYSIQVTVPSIAGKVLGTNNDHALALILWMSAGAYRNARTGSLGIQNNTFDIWGVQVEEGSVATPFDKKTFADELRACQRYYVRLGGEDAFTTLGDGVCDSSTSAFITCVLPVPLRTFPTLGLIGGTRRLHSGAMAWTENMTPVLRSSYNSKTRPAIYVGVSSGLTPGSYLMYDCNNSAGYIDFNAEL
jgi:hypothetical protein